MNNTQNNKGFSLVEFLVYIGIFAASATFLIGILLIFTRVQVSQSSMNAVNSQVLFVNSFVQDRVRSSSLIDMPAGVSTSTLTLRMASSTLDPTLIYWDEDSQVVLLKEGAGDPAALTDSNVNVTNFSVIKYTNPGGHDVAQISMSIDFDTENDRAKYQRSIQTSISRVSAATFDSDGLPNANDTFDLGNATYRWKDLYLSGNAYIGTATEDEHAVRKDQTTISRNADITVTVGSSGDYSSINDALEYLTETYNPTFINEGFTAEIELMSGFEMQEQILVKGLDLSWITITSIDDEVSVDRSSLDTLFLDNYPVFGVDNGSLPVVDVLFSMDSSGDGSGRSGFKGNNCNITILDGGGMENAGGVGLYVISCKVFANGSIFNNSNSIGVYTENSVVNFEGAQINGSVGDGMRLQYGSVGNLYQIEINNSSQRGLKVVSATAFANGSTITNSGSDNVYASAAATGSFDSSTLTGAGAYGIASYRASNISGHNSNTTGAVSGGFRVRYGGVIDATGSGVQGSLSQSANSLTADGIIFQ